MKNTNVNQIAYIYAYVASSYEAGKKLFDEFVPLIEYYFAEKKSLSSELGLTTISVELNEFYGINIPKATLLRILQTMQEENKVLIRNDRVLVNRENLNQHYVEVRKNIEGDLDELYADFTEFLLLNNVKATKDTAKNLLYKLVINNAPVFAEYYGLSKKVENLSIEYSELIAKYFNSNLKANERIKNIFVSLLIGAQKTALLNLKPDKLKEFESTDMSFQSVFLVCNYALRLLGLQEKLNNEVAMDTLIS